MDACELPRNDNFLVQIGSWFCHLNFNYPAGSGWGRVRDLDSDASVSPVTLTQVTKRQQRQQQQFECQNWRETCEHVTWTLTESATLGWMPRKALCAMRHAWLSLIPLVSPTNTNLFLSVSLSLQLHHWERLVVATARRNLMNAFVASSHR